MTYLTCMLLGPILALTSVNTTAGRWPFSQDIRERIVASLVNRPGGPPVIALCVSDVSFSERTISGVALLDVQGELLWSAPLGDGQVPSGVIAGRFPEEDVLPSLVVPTAQGSSSAKEYLIFHPPSREPRTITVPAMYGMPSAIRILSIEPLRIIVVDCEPGRHSAVLSFDRGDNLIKALELRIMPPSGLLPSGMRGMLPWEVTRASEMRGLFPWEIAKAFLDTGDLVVVFPVGLLDDRRRGGRIKWELWGADSGEVEHAGYIDCAIVGPPSSFEPARLDVRGSVESFELAICDANSGLEAFRVLDRGTRVERLGGFDLTGHSIFGYGSGGVEWVMDCDDDGRPELLVATSKKKVFPDSRSRDQFCHLLSSRARFAVPVWASEKTSHEWFPVAVTYAPSSPLRNFVVMAGKAAPKGTLVWLSSDGRTLKEITAFDLPGR